jgi:cyclophilin family peptidyl-prolyl cis-trans isomerase
MIPAPTRRVAGLLTTIAVAAAVAAGCSGTSGASTAASAAASPAPASSSGTSASCPTSQPEPLAAGETRTVVVETEKGNMTIALDADLSPIAVGNFVALADCGFYDGTVFHRVVPGFVIQGGGRDDGPGYTIQDEPVTTDYHRGTVAMARSSQPNSVDSQFFIVLDDAAEGPLASYNTYQIIGEVTAGMEVADAITAAAGGIELPADPIAMTKVTVSNP